MSSIPTPKTRLTEPQKRMFAMVDSLQKYMANYHEQACYLDYQEKTFIDDVLYGLGRAISLEYRNANGFDKFKDFLRAYLSPSSEKAPTEEALRDQITGLESTLDEQCRLAAEYSIRLSYIASMPDEDNEWDAVTKYQMARAIARNPMTEDK